MNKFSKFIRERLSINILLTIAIVFIIVISTLFPTLFNPDKADWKQIVSNFTWNAIITILAMVSQMSSASERLKRRENGDYTKARNLHIDKAHEIQNKQLSKLHELYVKDQNIKNKIAYVKELFAQFEIDFKLYDCDISLLKTALKKKLINKDQYQVIKLCRSNKIHYDYWDVRDLTSTQILKNSKNTNKSQSSFIIITNICGKLSWILAGAIFLGTLVPDAVEGGVSAQSWINLSSRIFTFVGGMWCGETTGKEVVEDDIRLFDKFYAFNSQFIQDFTLGIWKPKEEEISKDIIAELQALQKEEDTPLKEDIQEKPQEIEITLEQLQAIQRSKGV